MTRRQDGDEEDVNFDQWDAERLISRRGGQRRGGPETMDELEAAVLREAARKQGTSQIIKYLDLSLFKIEKCKNFASGKQHNIKLCRYYHTVNDRRRELDYSFITDAAQLQPCADVNDLMKLVTSLYTPDLCSHQD